MSDEMITAGGAIFGKLKALGVEHVFVNSGTDFPPIVEGLVEAGRRALDLPEPIICRMKAWRLAWRMATIRFLASRRR